MTEALTWHQGMISSGHGVASGRAIDSPYPKGSIAMQRPYFDAVGIDLSTCWSGTINLSFAPYQVRLRDPDHCVERLHWTDLHPPETFSFWKVKIKLDAEFLFDAWIYHPDPATKQCHWQPKTTLEILAPWIDGITPGRRLYLADVRQRVKIVDVVRLRSRLLEGLKFRVLASQDQFYLDQSSLNRRCWLKTFQPEALDLTDDELDQVWVQARELYMED